MSKTLFKEKAYKILAEQYSSLYTRILYRARNAKQYGKQDDQLLVVETIIDREKYEYNGIQSKVEAKIVETLEYLLNDDEPVK